MKITTAIVSCRSAGRLGVSILFPVLSLIPSPAYAAPRTADRRVMQLGVSGAAPGETGAAAVTANSTAIVRGRTVTKHDVRILLNGSRSVQTRSDARGRFTVRLNLEPGVNFIDAAVPGEKRAKTRITVISAPHGFSRPFDGSPTKPSSPFTRLLADSKSYGADLKPREDAKVLSDAMKEQLAQVKFSDTITLGMVFFAQFVDHDLDFNDSKFQGPSSNSEAPLNKRTPALDLDSLYGKGPADQPALYTDDGLFFKLAPSENDLLRDADGIAQVADPRNDQNGFVGVIHLSFLKYHNLLMTRSLRGQDPDALDAAAKTAIFNQVRNQVVGYYQGIVANQMSAALTGKSVPESFPAISNVPVEFAAAVYRLGHTLVPNEVVVDDLGTRKSPVDPELRRPGTLIRTDLLFGKGAQMAAGFDDRVAPVMRELLIPFSPTNPAKGHFIGGKAANLGSGKVIDGVMHLDLIETNILRGREQKLPSGEEYAAQMIGIPYDPKLLGTTDLWVYVLREARVIGHLGPVGADIYYRTIGGLLAADPHRYTNPELFTRGEILAFRSATIENLLKEVGEPVDVL